MRAGGWLALVIVFAPVTLSGQSGGAGGSLLARADSLHGAGNTEAARVAFEEVLQMEPDNSRALFQLARLLEPDSPRAIQMLRRYTRLEPQDAWGHWAVGEALAAADSLQSADEALMLAQRIEPDERDFIVGRARVLARSDRTEAAIAEYGRWLEIDPDDVEALRELAAQLRRLRREGAEAATLRRLLLVEPDAAAERRLTALRAAMAPAVEPTLRVSRDSDGNTVAWARLRADSRIGEGARLGFVGGRIRSGDGLQTATAWDGALSLDWRDRSAGIGIQAGAAGLARRDPSAGSEIIPLLRLRARWRPDRGPSAELRLQREPVSASPLLLASPVVLAEARGTTELPIAGPLYARGTARAGRLTAPGESNDRIGLGGGGSLRLGSTTEVGAQYQRTRYARDTDAGYFAPKAIDSAEVGVYTEVYGLWPLVLALDAGAGAERITDWGAPGGGWERAFRLWSLLSWTVRPGLELRLETEAYETRSGVALAPTEGAWRWGSLGLSMRTAVR